MECGPDVADTHPKDEDISAMTRTMEERVAVAIPFRAKGAGG